MPLTPSIGTCQAEIIMPLAFPVSPPSSLQFFIGITPITGAMSDVPASNVGIFNFTVSSDPTYIAWSTSTGGSLLGTAYDIQGLHVLVTVPSAAQITDLAIGSYAVPPTNPNPLTFSASFICNIQPSPKPKPRKRGGVPNNAFSNLPSIQCFQRQRDINGNLIPCAERLRLFGGAIYMLDPNNSNDKICCYTKTNLSQ